MDDSPGIRRYRKEADSFHFLDSGPVPGLDLAQDYVARADTDDIERSEAGAGAGALVTGGLQNGHRAAFVPTSFCLGIHGPEITIATLNYKIKNSVSQVPKFYVPCP